ncbi:MAG: hypothetical protein WCT20_01030 [Candidatus Babeliales bacterium]
MGVSKKVFCLVLMAMGTVDEDILSAGAAQQRQLTTGTAVSADPPLLVKGKLNTPVAGSSYTIKYLYDLINAKNKNKTSNFLVPVGTNGRPIDDSHCWQNPPQISGSKPVSALGITPAWIQKNGSMSVQLFEDRDLIKFFFSEKPYPRLDATTRAKYQKILLYFIVPIDTRVKNQATGKIQQGTVSYRCYLNDPYPGRMRGSLLRSINPAADIIKNWDI